MSDILSSRLSCGEFDETSFMVEIGSFHEGLQEASRNEIALSKSYEIGRNECDGWLVIDSPNSTSPDTTSFEYYSTGDPDIGIFPSFSNYIHYSSDDDFQISASNSLFKECHSTSSSVPLPLSTNLVSESLPMSTGLLKLAGGQSFPTENMAVLNESCDDISRQYANHEQQWPEKGTMEEIERNCHKRSKMVDQDMHQEFRCVRKRLISAGERSVDHSSPQTCIAGEMAVNNSPTAGISHFGGTMPNSDRRALITAGTAHNNNLKPRARRGSATDPQSVYARNRRERINERLKTLQNLVPNGTKVDISTMLEQAIQYVLFMQLQIKLLRSDEHWMYTPIAFNGMDITALETTI